MRREPDQRLRDAFAVTAPDALATKRARAAALATLPTRRRVPRIAVVLAAAVAGMVTVGAASLAASGNLHVHLGAPAPAAPRPLTHLTIPPDSNGIALVAGGRLWLATRGGLRIEGMPASTAELSPRALYAVVGVGSSLVAFAPGERRAWTHPTAGPVVAAAWSPDGLKIAYVVQRRAEYNLRLIEGDGDHDRLLGRRV